MIGIDNDFEQTAAQINRKIVEAATALREANRLAREAGLPSLIYTQYTSEYDSTLDTLSEEERESLENDPEWDGESSPMKMKADLIDVSALEKEIEKGGWSTSSSYC